ncbi:MAG: PASTA domain-containing protein [Flavobacteriales bacterium]|nr:PASTA domain-containing protein [Flavobacteriales bacterium]
MNKDKLTIGEFFKNIYVKEILKVAAVFCVLISIFYFYMSHYTRHDDVYATPDFSTMTLEEAAKVIQEQGYRYVVVDSSRYEPSKRPRAILFQDPAAGEGIKKDRKIYLKINRSSWEKATVPHVDFENDKVDNVARRLTAAGFKVGKTIYEPHIGENVVLGLSVNGRHVSSGASLHKMTVIDIIAGDGGKMTDTTDVVEETEEF